VQQWPEAAHGAARNEMWKFECTSDCHCDDYEPGTETGRIRLTLPWTAPDGDRGEVQIDMTIGDYLPEVLVCTAVPRSDGLLPLGLRTVTRELSPAWKLHCVNGGSSW
jgi:hypothetical protein